MICINTYNELSEIVGAFGGGYLNMVVVVSEGGLGKSQEVLNQFEEGEIVSVGGHVTPLRLYELFCATKYFFESA